MNLPIYIVDLRAALPDVPCYPVLGVCANCGIYHVALFSHGQLKPEGKTGRCPYCRCRGTVAYSMTVEAYTLLADQVRPRRFVAWGDGGLMDLPDTTVAGIDEPIIPPKQLAILPIVNFPAFVAND